MFDPSYPVSGAKPLRERLTQLIARSQAAQLPIVFVRNCGGIGDPTSKERPDGSYAPP